jgi:RHS repeat-associated protein
MTINQKGRLTSVGNGSMRISYAYDALGRSTGTIHKLDGSNYIFRTAYGYPQNPGTPGLGTVPVSETFPDSEVVAYSYDASGAQQSVRTTRFGGTQQTIVDSVLRNALGQTTQVIYGNNAVSTHTYNSSNLRLSQIRTIVGATTLQDYQYSFDNKGNVTGVSDAVNSTLSATYGYDSLDQLTLMTANSNTLTYAYDATGNLTNKESATQTYGGAQSCAGCSPNRGPHALATANGVVHNYDANGNLISTSNGIAVTWNAENMPTQLSENGVVRYQKFFLGEMLWKKIELSMTTYYLPSMRIENGGYRKFFGGLAERSPDGLLRFYHNDHLGSAALVTDSNALVQRRQAYKPYGEDRFVSGTFSPKYQFNFKEKESTGFYDYGARLYNPATGRWLSPDNVANAGPNRYAYVNNSPLMYTDPSGHFPVLTGLIYALSQRQTFLDHFVANAIVGRHGRVSEARRREIGKSLVGLMIFLYQSSGNDLGNADVRAQLAYMIATAEHENARFSTLEEYPNRFWRNYRGGPYYHGRGGVHTTHKSAYDTLNQSDNQGNCYVCVDPKWLQTPFGGAMAAVSGWSEGRGKAGVQGPPITHYFKNGQYDWLGARRGINGGEYRVRPWVVRSIADRARLFFGWMTARKLIPDALDVPNSHTDYGNR